MSNTTNSTTVWVNSEHAVVLGRHQWRHVVDLPSQTVIVWVRKGTLGNLVIEVEESKDAQASTDAVTAVLKSGPFKVGLLSIEVTL